MNSTEQLIFLIALGGVALLIVFVAGLVTGWTMGKRLLRSVMAAANPNYNDSKPKIGKGKHSTHDDNRNPFNDAHISEPMPTRIDTLDEEKK